MRFNKHFYQASTKDGPLTAPEKSESQNDFVSSEATPLGFVQYLN